MGSSSFQIQLTDFVGEHGCYQLSLTAFLFIRYIFLGLMSNSGPLMTPDVSFYCQLPIEQMVVLMPNITQLGEREREKEMKEELNRTCQLDLQLYEKLSQFRKQNSSSTIMIPVGDQHSHDQQSSSENQQQLTQVITSLLNGTTSIQPFIGAPVRECTEFSYDILPDQGRTMTSEFDLVCDREWLRSLFQSLVSSAIVVAHVFWGTFSDKFGRFKAQKLCIILSLIAGVSSIFATDYWTFLICRAVCSFSDLGLVVSMTTTVVELVGNQYRGLSVALVNFGSAFGVSIFPYIMAYFEDFRKVIAFTVLCHLFTMPLVWSTNESVRWLISNRRYQAAKRELRRISRWNYNYRRCVTWLHHGLVRFWSGKEQAGESFHDSANDEEAFRISFNQLFSQYLIQLEADDYCDPLHWSVFRESSSNEPSDVYYPEPVLDCIESDYPAMNSTSKEEVNTNTSGTGYPVMPEFGRYDNETDKAQLKTEAASTEVKQKEENLKTISAKGLSVSASPMPVTTGHLLTWNFMKGALSSWEPDLVGSLERARSCGRLDSLKREINAMAIKSDVSYHDYDTSKAAAVARRMRNPHRSRQPDCINIVASQLTFMGRVSRLFKNKELMIVVFTIVWTTFNSELQYTSFIIINLEVGEDVYLNYMLGGCMEALAAVVASVLLSYASRRHTLITFWLLISLFCFGLSVAHIDSTWAVWLLALAKFSQSCLSSVASVAAYESFPTFLRQSGSGLVFTLGMMGSVFAPLIFAEFDDQAGMDRVLMTFSIFSLIAALMIYRFLIETKNRDLQ